jgi:hypothetical protein
MVRQCSVITALVVACAGCGGNPSGPSPGGNTTVTVVTITGAGQLDLIGVANSLVATATRANGTSSVVTASATWQSSNPLVVTITPAGVATAVGLGTTLISATYGGVSAVLSARVGAPIDCFSYVPGTLTVLAESGEFVVASPVSTPQGPAFALLASFATASDAAAGLAVFQRYVTYCHVGRNTSRVPRLDYVFSYWLNLSGLMTTINNEDCEPYDRSSVQVVSRGSTGWAVVASGRDLLLLDTAADATTMAEMIRTYSNQCYIGRGNTRPNPNDFIVPYWK